MTWNVAGCWKRKREAAVFHHQHSHLPCAPALRTCPAMCCIFLLALLHSHSLSRVYASTTSLDLQTQPLSCWKWHQKAALFAARKRHKWTGLSSIGSTLWPRPRFLTCALPAPYTFLCALVELLALTALSFRLWFSNACTQENQDARELQPLDIPPIKWEKSGNV